MDGWLGSDLCYLVVCVRYGWVWESCKTASDCDMREQAKKKVFRFHYCIPDLSLLGVSFLLSQLDFMYAYVTRILTYQDFLIIPLEKILTILVTLF